MTRLKGGSKRMYLRLHWGEIARFRDTHSEQETMRQYGIKRPETLQRLLAHPPHGAQELVIDRPQAITNKEAGERALIVADKAGEDVRQLRIEVRELREAFAAFVPLVADCLRSGVILPELTRLIGPAAGHFTTEAHVDPLSLANIGIPAPAMSASLPQRRPGIPQC